MTLSPGAADNSRIGSLDVLPLFFPLKGRAVCLVGGSIAAAWKAELLLAAGARIDLFAHSLCEHMQSLSGNPDLSFSGRDWRCADPQKYVLVVADIEKDDEAQVLVDHFGRCNVPVNVVDNPRYCTFQFGSIINRSPVVIGVSTHGAAPVLAQALRRRIEALLPRRLGEWAALAAKMRPAICDILRSAGHRRQFWENFVDRVFAFSPGGPMSGHEEATLLNLARAKLDISELPGVVLVGAGPGDPELLTMRAMRELQAADVILIDDLVPPEIVELSRREAQRIHVGKRGGRKSCSQSEINDLMLAHAQSGRRVVRLKSGDPSLFGRAGEEIEFLMSFGVPVRIVPGITAASAMAAGATTSLTHRLHSRAVLFVTGHSKNGTLPTDLDWRAISNPSSTTVFYMGGRTIRDIQERLIEERADPQTPAIMVANASRPDERIWRGSISALIDGVGMIGLHDPVLVGIGAVFAERKSISAPTSTVSRQQIQA
ncbi:siroheme synthase CysG (plasmid) [Shinella sp. H4-D48]|uniref:siroheme synthase CysG n=1 Tax=Shinella sp. H4-D48 TaxID=2925841 RepID=UPI001F52C776|nr:siroheme synthase CysG [Shinella sp. H4-D48]UNK40933.1 siroheme synthase CysG [Shinella sp. H4-D48]